MLRSIAVCVAAVLAVALVSCGSESKTPASEPPKKAETPKPVDESRRFPKDNLVETKVVDKEILGKSFMPGGTLATYRRGKTEYQMFVVKTPTPQDAAILLPDWNRALTGSKMEPAFGGYFGEDAGRPVFVFAKGPWIAGVVGLPEKQADAQARLLAAGLD